MSEIITIILAKTMLPELIFFLNILNLRYFFVLLYKPQVPPYYLVPGGRLVYFILFLFT